MTGREDVPPGPYTVAWPDHQGGWFKVWGHQGTPPDFADGWAIPLVAMGTQGAMEAICDLLNERALEPAGDCPMCGGTGTLYDVTESVEAAQARGVVLVPVTLKGPSSDRARDRNVAKRAEQV